jgi:outer membrane protein, heavy metal efflux system
MLAACSTPVAEPVDTMRSLQALQTRRLDDARLQKFVESARTEPPAQSPPAWDLDRLTLAALYFHPDLSIARSELELAQAQATTARARPNPAISAVLGRGAAGEIATSPWIVGAAIDFLLQPGDRRALRIEQADSGVRAARADLRQASWLVRARVYAAWLDLWSAQRRLDTLREQLELQTARAGLFERRLEAGENSRSDLRRELAQREQLAAAVAQAETELARARVDLAAAVGVAAGALDAVVLPIDSLDRPPTLDDRLLADAARGHALTERADVRDAVARLDAAQADLQAEVSRRWPDLRLGPGYLFDQGTDKYELSIGLQWPSSIEGAVAEARARRDLAANRLLALQARIVGQIDRAGADWRTSAQLARAAQALSDRMQQRERAAQAQFEAGLLDRPAWLAARIDRLDAQRSELAARERQRRALAALEDALQQMLEGEQPIPSAPEADPVASGATAQ